MQQALIDFTGGFICKAYWNRFSIHDAIQRK